MNSDRLARERAFHNERYADDSTRRGRIARFYSAMDYGFDLYKRQVLMASAGHVVVEYGCGTGTLTLALAPVAKRVIGVDISEAAIDQAKKYALENELANVEYAVQNVEEMTFPGKSVDVIAGVGIVHHLDIPRACGEVIRVLKDHGVAIFAEPLGHNPLLNWYRRRTPQIRTADEHPLLLRDIEYMTKRFGSSAVTYFGLVTPLLGLIPHSGSGVLKPMMCWLDRILCAVPMFRRFAWYCIIELRQEGAGNV